MDSLITYDEAAEFLKNPPTMLPRPDFAKLRALRKHMTQALKQLVCPQSQIHGWTGLVMAPGLYSLIETFDFFIPPDPGPVPMYTPFATPSAIKMVDYAFERDKNYYLSFRNINRACFRMLDDSVPIQFKVSNLANLTGWNASMSIQDILTQMETSYGKPTPMAMHNNDILFRSPMATTEAPEMLFYRIEQCQEIATLAGDPFTAMQVVNTAVRILMQAQVLPTKEFDTWEQTPLKSYPALKTFIHAAYTRRLQSLALRTTTGQHGYAPGGNTNMFHALGDPSEGDDTDTADDTTTTTQIAAVTTGSTIGNTYGGNNTIPSEITTAINQLAANQIAIQQQMAAMTFAAPPPTVQPPFHIPPIQQMGQHSFAAGTQGLFTAGRGVGGRQRNRFKGRGGSRGGGRGRGMFATQPQATVGSIPPYIGGPPGHVTPITGTRVNAPFQSNVTKKHANWNVCWSCGFDVEDGHTSATCPTHWRKTDHQVGFTRETAQQWINQGYTPCTKGMHKTKLPTRF
jgi:hypothetical protein